MFSGGCVTNTILSLWYILMDKNNIDACPSETYIVQFVRLQILRNKKRWKRMFTESRIPGYIQSPERWGLLNLGGEIVTCEQRPKDQLSQAVSEGRSSCCKAGWSQGGHTRAGAGGCRTCAPTLRCGKLPQDSQLWQDLLYTFRYYGCHAKNRLQWSIRGPMSQAYQKTNSRTPWRPAGSCYSHTVHADWCGSQTAPGLRGPELDYRLQIHVRLRLKLRLLRLKLKTWLTPGASSFQDYLIKIQKENWIS